MQDIVINLTGEVCPVPLIRVRQLAAKLLPGQRLQVEVDYSRSVLNILDWCEQNGYRVAVDETGQEGWRVSIWRQAKD